jgi:hypothetical protein
LYIDGVLVDSEVTDVAPEMNELPFRMGMNTHTTDRNFKGKIDDVRIYNRALSETGISELWHPGSAGVDLAPYFNFTAGRNLLFLDFDSDGAGGLESDDLYLETTISLRANLLGDLTLHEPDWLPKRLVMWSEELGLHYRFGVYDFGDFEFQIYLDPVGPLDGIMQIGETVQFDYWEFVSSTGTYRGPWRTEMTLDAAGFPYPTPAGLFFPDCALVRLEHYKDGALDGTTLWVLAEGVGPVLQLDLGAAGTYNDMNLLLYAYETEQCLLTSQVVECIGNATALPCMQSTQGCETNLWQCYRDCEEQANQEKANCFGVDELSEADWLEILSDCGKDQCMALNPGPCTDDCVTGCSTVDCVEVCYPPCVQPFLNCISPAQ